MLKKAGYFAVRKLIGAGAIAASAQSVVSKFSPYKCVMVVGHTSKVGKASHASNIHVLTVASALAVLVMTKRLIFSNELRERSPRGLMGRAKL